MLAALVLTLSVNVALLRLGAPVVVALWLPAVILTSWLLGSAKAFLVLAATLVTLAVVYETSRVAASTVPFACVGSVAVVVTERLRSAWDTLRCGQRRRAAVVMAARRASAEQH